MVAWAARFAHRLCCRYSVAMNETVIILDNIRSAYNVGSIFRTADAAGVTKLYLAGITPAPVDRFGRAHAEIAKTSLGATDFVAWEKVGSGADTASSELVELITQLKADGYTVIAVEQSPEAVSIYEVTRPPKVAYVFGAEVEGVQSGILSVVDLVVEIPMLGQKESLNVSVTAGIVLFQPH